MKSIRPSLMMILGVLLSLTMTTINAGAPLWTFEPQSSPTISVPANGSATLQYRITNQSNNLHTLVMTAIPGITQTTTGIGVCANPFVLPGKGSCILSLQIDGSQLTGSVVDGPVVCQQDSTNLCYRPAATNILHITPAPPILNAVITVTGSPLTLNPNGATGQLTINNTSSDVAATNIMSNFTGTALDGNVTETGNTCVSVAPGGSCTLTYTPGSTLVTQTNFPIQGTNTNTVTAAIAIVSGSTLTGISPTSGVAAGGTGVTLTGTGLTGATSVTFDGIAATSVNPINATTVYAVTPAHAVGAVNVVITTPVGSGTLTNGFTYVTTAVGLPSGGGVVACLGGGLNQLIAATSDVNNGATFAWGQLGVTTQANSFTDGASNTALIALASGTPPFAANQCDTFTIDSQGHTPCQSGNTCYSDWFLPAQNQLNCLCTNQNAIGLTSFTDYWSSFQDQSDTALSVLYVQTQSCGTNPSAMRNQSKRLRCARILS